MTHFNPGIKDRISVTLFRSQGRRLVVLGMIVMCMGILHLAVFDALEIVAPIGSGFVEDDSLVIDSEDFFRAETFEDWMARRLMADAR